MRDHEQGRVGVSKCARERREGKRAAEGARPRPSEPSAHGRQPTPPMPWSLPPACAPPPNPSRLPIPLDCLVALRPPHLVPTHRAAPVPTHWAPVPHSARCFPVFSPTPPVCFPVCPLSLSFLSISPPALYLTARCFPVFPHNRPLLPSRGPLAPSDSWPVPCGPWLLPFDYFPLTHTSLCVSLRLAAPHCVTVSLCLCAPACVSVPLSASHCVHLRLCASRYVSLRLRLCVPT